MYVIRDDNYTFCSFFYLSCIEMYWLENVKERVRQDLLIAVEIPVQLVHLSLFQGQQLLIQSTVKLL